MANYSFWALGESHVSVSGGVSLDGITQGDGSHLVGETITLNSNAWEQISVRDRGGDTNFDDNDSNQRLAGSQTFDGTTFGNNTRIEAEYEFVLLDPSTGLTYRVISVNFNNSSPAYGTVEGLAFVDEFPPVGVPLTVISAQEGPTGGSAVDQSNIAAPPCFTPGTLIRVRGGQALVEDIQVGDLVKTLDHGFQPVRWVGCVTLTSTHLAANPSFHPVRIQKDAFGAGRPCRDLTVSPQHRVLLEGWRAELICGEPQVLAAAVHLVNDRSVRVVRPTGAVIYIHLQFDRHEIVDSEGLLSESLYAGPVALRGLPHDSRAELEALFPELTQGEAGIMARPVAQKQEVQAIQLVG
ncbi:Hint domain-containing protein [Shimia sagamensis]|uniref:Hint domain-containing protein n=1 Tax=Shimia sagamensis TaxID=1566352 RepID=A0ABY1NNY0_9RHOB|nr:Hint domain-containing protein [Shimia sagamensis]SMP12445.1 Hint domain-containing protein [Shimia sagamensis]